MKFSIAATLVSIIALVSAVAVEEPGMTAVRRSILLMERAGANDGRGVSNGACCVAEKNKKEDVCKVDGADGKCVPADTANCGKALTCIANNKLKCDANVLENGKPTCRLAA